MNESNPYQAPLHSHSGTENSSGPIEPTPVDSLPHGWPEPSTLALLGWVLAVSVFVLLGFGIGIGTEAPAIYLMALFIPFLRLVWFIYSLVNYRRYGVAWTKRSRIMLVVTLYINSVLLLIDALALLLGACAFVISSYNSSN